MIQKQRITGYILAGGRSSRMGQDKGLMLINGIPWVEHIAKQLKQVVDTVVLVTNNSMYNDLGYQVISDRIKGLGPVGAIYTVLKHSVTTQNIIMSCDTPFVTEKLLRLLLSESKNQLITIPSNQNRVHPLVGVYDRSLWLLFQQAIELNQLKVQQVIEQTQIKHVPIDTYECFLPHILMNINTPTEYEKALKLWK